MWKDKYILHLDNMHMVINDINRPQMNKSEKYNMSGNNINLNLWKNIYITLHNVHMIIDDVRWIQEKSTKS